MWLIDTRTLQLVEFHGDPHVDYAILSHTWGSDEVSFASFKALGPMSKDSRLSIRMVLGSQVDIKATAGYKKIQRTAILARRHDIWYLWVDTCCIDKTSSAELSESINSMYRWYQKAKVCYAFLSDVEPTSTSDPYSPSSSFRRSRWFTRGWTLQELIAPKTVKFYAHDWSYIATKAPDSSFRKLLMEITGIGEQVLAGAASLSDISVANKMRWAAKRQTTRQEDKAYCLLGLFNVNMPLLYGEGTRAFVRLQEEILKETDDHSLFLWSLSTGPLQPQRHLPVGTRSPLYGLLAESPDRFSGLDFDHVRPLPPSDSSDSAPSSFTNQGLRTTMLLVPVISENNYGDEYLAVLDCTFTSPHLSVVECSPCIILRRLWGDQFARIALDDGTGVIFPPKHYDDTDGTYERIYVK